MSATVLPPPDIVIEEEALPAEGLRCPMCEALPVHARPGIQRAEGLNIVLTCPACGNWHAVMFVAWIELFPEIAEGDLPHEED